MKTPVVLLAFVTVLFHTPASRAYTIKSQKDDQLDDGHGRRVTQTSEDGDALSEGMDGEHLMVIKESTGNDLHDIRKRELSKRQSNKRYEELRGESPADVSDKHRKMLRGMTEVLDPVKDMIVSFMKPILDRIKQKPNAPDEEDTSPDSVSSAVAANSTSSKCSLNEMSRKMETMSLLFPDLKSSDGQPFAFVPLTNALIRAAEQELYKKTEQMMENVNEEEDMIRK